MKKRSFILSTAIILFACISSFNFLNAQVKDSVKVSRIEIKVFHSRILSEDRKIYIQTPSYMKMNETYPVLYLLDAEAQMAMVAGQVQYMSESYPIIPGLIVVGIANTDRMRDLTPTHSILGADGKPDTSANSVGRNSGGGEKFLQFIKEELMPFIEGRYPTAPYKILAGHSLGGLTAVHAMVNHPGMFNSYIALSPSLQWDNQNLLKQVTKEFRNDKNPGQLLFFSDASEDAYFHQNIVKLDSVMRQKNIPNSRVKYSAYPGETHVSEPIKGFYDGLRFIYPDWWLPMNSAFRKTVTAQIVKEHYDKLSATYGYKVIPLQQEINQLAKAVRNDPDKIADAIALLQLNAGYYPSSSAIQELLGETYIKAGDNKNALVSYNNALKLDPANEKLKEKIKSIPQ
ncbi:MAG: hypothetical protein JWN76_2044 [Chitinophagaceae bacterium]|nr:hypothetical protein [Chitinophagaceae bacterium]